MKNHVLRIAFCSLFSLAGFAGLAKAQEVDFDVPTEINIIDGRLSVTFQDHVSEPEAQALVMGMGLGILQSNFKELHANSLTDRRFTEQERSQLEKNPRVEEVKDRALPTRIRSTDNADQLPRYSLAVNFTPNTSQEQALEILQAATPFTFSFIPKPANEIVVEVDGGQEENAVTMLQDQDEVKWVTYVGVAAGN